MRTSTALLLASITLCAQDRADLNAVHRIKHEASANSKVMDHLYHLTDLYGPRLTASPGFMRAASWAVSRFKEWGLDNVHLEAWPFGRAWTARHYSVEIVEPGYYLLTARPMAWTRASQGAVTGDAYYMPLDGAVYSLGKAKAFTEAIDKLIAAHKGKLKGKVALIAKQTPITAATQPDFRRLDSAALADRAKSPDPIARPEFDLDNPRPPEDESKLDAFFRYLPEWAMVKLFDRQIAEITRLNKFLSDEGAAGILTTDNRSKNGMVFAEAAGSHRAADPLSPPKFVLTREQYNRIVRLIEHKQNVRIRLNLDVEVSDRDVDGHNIIAEIPGGAKKDEIVMIGAHFDSWHTGTGATDNATGSAVMMEVMRILKSLGLKLDRTVRLALWGGEEQGYYGSVAYVKKHFGDPETMKLLPAHEKLSVYFNHDNGTGRIRGVYLQGNDAARPFFEAGLAPFRDMDAATISIRNTGGTDHVSFDAIGLPGFQFIQDPAAYGSITHHSDMDVYDHVEASDLMQASAIIASLVYQAANRPEMFPRKPLPDLFRK